MTQIENSSPRHPAKWSRWWEHTAVWGWPAWAWGIIATGTFLRVSQYACGRSLWNDEAELALNILHLPWKLLFQPLQYHQGAPIGFLLLEKIATALGGKSEITLRAIPFAAGVGALFAFYRVAKLYLSSEAVPIALTLFALSRSLVYYSSEAKQYSTDVLVTLLVLRAVYKLLAAPLRGRELVEIGALGAVAVWFSHPASFVLAGTAAILITGNFVRGRSQGRTVWVFISWAASFGVCYVLSLRHLSHDDVLLDYWQGNFVPHHLRLIIPWMMHNFFAAFENPAPLNSILGASFFIAGCGQLLRHDRLRLGLLTAPLLVLFLASWLHLYPLYGRLLLFLCPILLLLVSEGAIWIYKATRRFSPALAAALIGLLLARPAYLAADTLIRPIRAEDIKAGFRYIESRQRPGDPWYVYYSGKYQVAYYAEVDALPIANVRIGSDCGGSEACYGTDLQPFRSSPRLWVLLSHIQPSAGGDEGVLLRDQLDSVGTRLETFDTAGVRVYRYDLDRPVPVAK